MFVTEPVTPYDKVVRVYFRNEKIHANDVDTKDHPLLEIVFDCIDQAELYAEQDLLNFEETFGNLMDAEIETLEHMKEAITDEA